MERRILASLVLFLALVVDILYGVLTHNTAYGCTTGIQTAQPASGLNLKVLTEPCFYVYYFGILGGSALLILLIPPPRKRLNLPRK